MRVKGNTYTVADIYHWLKEGNLTINKVYQRESRLWPLNARSYFIDTILNNFPFPKVTLLQKINLKTQKTIREVIDGQQRIMTIKDFVDNKLRLTSSSTLHHSKIFSELEEEKQTDFLNYSISVDTILSEDVGDVLEIFRRINSYTIPLNKPELRHAVYQGEFKWFIKDMIANYSPIFEKYSILTIREISRMKDADLMTELCQILDKQGIVSRSYAKLEKLYKDNDQIFKDKNKIKDRLINTLDFIKVDLNPICESGILKGYLFYSLFSALVYNKWGIKNIDPGDFAGLDTIGVFTNNLDSGIQNLMFLLGLIEQNEFRKDFNEFVQACISTTHSLKNREIRLKWFVAALQDKLREIR